MLMKHQVGKLELPTLDVAGDIVAQAFSWFRSSLNTW